ncbi:MAG: pyridoxal-phosphate dependent enzyme [Bacillaceae bacterium]|nr:pyridoxal-phosphate dependent enzyme [Bacillaceae bacterium]
MYQLNKNMIGFQCIRCHSIFEVKDYFKGCPLCLEEGYPASLTALYDYQKVNIDRSQRGLQRYTDLLPYRSFPTLGEGSTPIMELRDLARQIGVRHVWIKNEAQNPTGSHKDRMSPLIMARAKNMGYSTVVAASSGNAGVSIASYSAASGLKCVIIATDAIQKTYSKAIKMTGAKMIYTQTSLSRWDCMEKAVSNKGWYPATNFINPPVGSHVFGVEGYKTIAYEIMEELKETLPSIIVAPASRGDLIWGIYRGFRDARELGWINEIPKFVAVEPFPRLTRVIKGEDYRNHFAGVSDGLPSISGSTVTYQLKKTITDTKGLVKVVNLQNALQSQQELGRYGLYLETSSATIWSAITQLKHEVDESDRILAISTSHGFKGLSF